MIGINGVLTRFKEIAPLDEPACTKEHHEYKKETVTDAFAVEELVNIFQDEVLDLYPRERELLLLNTLYVRRAMVRFINSRYFDDINLIAPVHNKVRDLESKLAQAQEQLRQQEQRLQQLEQAATK